jgi:hypothetical protein
MVRLLEGQGLVPVPIFINGVEAHTVVRDQLTSAHERAALAAGGPAPPTLLRDAVAVDAVDNTIGFPLVRAQQAPAVFCVFLCVTRAHAAYCYVLGACPRPLGAWLTPPAATAAGTGGRPRGHHGGRAPG